MKIGIICHDAHPISEPFMGGLEMITFLLVTELVKRGHEVTSLCKQGSAIPGKKVYYRNTGTYESSDYNELQNLAITTADLNMFFQHDFDVIQNHSLHYQSIILGNITATPFITTFHTPVFPYLELGIKAVREHKNQTFIGVSESLSKLYEKELQKVDTIYNGIDVNKWEANFGEVQNYYAWCGRICKEKGVVQVIKLCIENKINLHIAGPVSHKGYYKDEVVPLLNSPYITYVGHLNQYELNQHIKFSKGFIFSSVWEEPYGLVLAEALACGVPVLANDVGAVREILTEQSGYIYTIEKPETFAAGLQVISKLSREACRERAESFCDYVTMVSHYENLYYSVAGRTIKTTA